MLDLGIVYLRFYQTFGRFPKTETESVLEAALKSGVYPSEMANAVHELRDTLPDQADEVLLDRLRGDYIAKGKKMQGAI